MMELMKILNENSSLINRTMVNNCSNVKNVSSVCAFSEETDQDVYILKIVINFVIIPISVVIGVFGNVSTIVVFYHKAKTSSTILIIGLAVSDLLMICIRLIHNIYSIGHLFFTEAIRFARPYSFVWIYLSYIPQRIGNCLILAIVMERFTAVWFPIKFKLLWTAKTTKIILASTALFNLGDLISGIHILIFSLNEEIPNNGVISTDKEVGRYFRGGVRFFQMCSLTYKIIAEVLPLLLVFLFNTLIIFGIRRNSMRKTEERRDKEAKMTRMLLSVSIIFVLLYGPLSITVTYTIFEVVEVSAVPFIMYEIFGTMTLLNSVINFVVYGLCNKTVRNEYIELWYCKKENSE